MAKISLKKKEPQKSKSKEKPVKKESKKAAKKKAKNKNRQIETTVSDATRRENARFLNIYMSVLIGIAGAYLFGYAGYIMQNEGMDVFGALGKAFEEISAFHLLFGLNQAAISGIFLGIVVAFIAFFLLQNNTEINYSYKKDEVSGTGGFMTTKQLKIYEEIYVSEEQYPLKGHNKNEKIMCDTDNMILSANCKRDYVHGFQALNNNVLIIGGSGTGKSYGCIKPNILQMNASFVVTDPAGEIIRSLGKTLSENGYKIKVFNIVDMKHSNTYNPFMYIREPSDVLTLVDCFIQNTTQKDEGKGEKFWVDSEKLLYSACIFYLRDHCDDAGKKNFATVLKMINSSKIDEQGPSPRRPVNPKDKNAQNDDGKSPLDKMFDALPQDSLAKTYYTAFCQSPSKTRMGIVISCLTRLQPFMMENVINLTSTDNIELDKIGDEKTALFIITPQSDNSPYNFLASMLYSQLFDTLYFKGMQNGLEKGKEELDVPVRCMMDEFANIGTIPGFPSKLATMRKYGISATIVLQDLSQIQNMYKDEWQTLCGNCSSTLFLGSPAQDTKKYISEELGSMTITSKSRGRSKGSKGSSSDNFQQTKREVMTIDELGRLPKDECIVFTAGLRPIRGKKYQGVHHPMWKETGSERNPERLFQYNKMPLYDNDKKNKFSTETMLRARAEGKRFAAEKEISFSMTEEEVKQALMPDGDDYNKLLNEMEITPQEEEDRMIHVICRECIKKLDEESPDERLSFLHISEIQKVAPKYLKRIIQEVSNARDLDCLVLFADNGAKEVFGCAYDITGTKIKDCMDQAQITDVCKEDPETGVVTVKVKAQHLEVYKKRLKDSYKKIRNIH